MINNNCSNLRKVFMEQLPGRKCSNGKILQWSAARDSYPSQNQIYA